MPSTIDISEYRHFLLDGYDYLEASYNDIDISTLQHQSDYNSKSFIVNTEETLDALNETFFETLNDFKISYVKYYLDKYENWDGSYSLIDTNEISGNYFEDKELLNKKYNELLFLKYRILVNLKALNADIASSETYNKELTDKYKNKDLDNLNNLDSGMKETLNDKTILYNNKFIYICNLSIVSLLICYIIYKKYSNNT